MENRVRGGYADTPLGQVHYRETGTGPPVVLFHESPLSGALYDATLPLLGHRVRAIAPDTPGYGASDPPPTPPSIADYSNHMAMFLDALGLGQVVLVGNHTGAAIAAQLAADLPERVRALIVVGCPLYTNEERQERLEYRLKPLPLASDGSHMTRIWRRYQRVFTTDIPVPVEALHINTIEYLRSIGRYDWAYRALFNFEMDQVLPLIACETFFLVTEGDLFLDKNEQAVALTLHAEGKVVSSPYHQYPSRDPVGFASEILAYLDRIGYLVTSTEPASG